MVLRWKFDDPVSLASYTVPVNPNQMSSPFKERALQYSVTTAVDGQVLVNEGNTPPREWQFQGSILDQAHFDAMFLWQGKRYRWYLTDHYGRRFTLYWLTFEPIPKRSVGKPWRHEYTVKAVIFGILAADGLTILQGTP